MRGIFIGSVVCLLGAGGASPQAGPTGTIAFADRVWPTNGGDNWEVFITDTSGRRVRRVTRSGGDDHGPAWSPDGRRIAHVCASGLCLIGRDGRSRRVISRTHLDGLTWSPNGASIAGTGRGWLRIVSVRTGRGRKVVPTQGYGASWSPDGRRIAFGRLGSRAGIWIVDRNGRNLRRLTVARDAMPKWSPDGRELAFMRRDDGIYAMGLDGTRGRFVSAAGEDPTWSPDSRWLAFTRSEAGAGGVWIVPVDEGQPPRRVVASSQPAGVSWTSR